MAVYRVSISPGWRRHQKREIAAATAPSWPPRSTMSPGRVRCFTHASRHRCYTGLYFLLPTSYFLLTGMKELIGSTLAAVCTSYLILPTSYFLLTGMKELIGSTLPAVCTSYLLLPNSDFLLTGMKELIGSTLAAVPAHAPHSAGTLLLNVRHAPHSARTLLLNARPRPTQCTLRDAYYNRMLACMLGAGAGQ